MSESQTLYVGMAWTFTRRRKMALLQMHTFEFSCLPCGFLALMSLADQ